MTKIRSTQIIDVTSSIQTQLDAKAPLATPTFTGTTTTGLLVVDNGASSTTLSINRAATNLQANIYYKTAGVQKWDVGMQDDSTNNYIIYNRNLSATALTISTASNAASFATDVSVFGIIYAYSGMYSFNGSNDYLGVLSSGGVNKILTTAGSTNKDISIAPGNVVAMTVQTGTGNVGIANTNPQEKLDITGSASISGGIELGHASDTTLTRSAAGILAVEGNPVPMTVASGRSTAQTAAIATVTSYTVPAVDSSYEVQMNVLVTTSTTHSFNVQVDYTDEGNTARTANLPFNLVGGTIGIAVSNVNGTVPYQGYPLRIRCKASTSITVKTAGTFTAVTYNVEASIRKI